MLYYAHRLVKYIPKNSGFSLALKILIDLNFLSKGGAYGADINLILKLHLHDKLVNMFSLIIVPS